MSDRKQAVGTMVCHRSMGWTGVISKDLRDTYSTYDWRVAFNVEGDRRQVDCMDAELTELPTPPEQKP